IAHSMQQAVEVRPIEKSEVQPFRPYFRKQRFEIFRLAAAGIADVVIDVLHFQKVENIRTTIQAAGLEWVFLLAEIEQGNVPERNVVEIEVAAKFELGFHELREPAA